jgi:hypothetical protein
MVPGQNLTLTTQATFAGRPNYIPVTTMTLMPQTINGTVSAVSRSGSFTTYTVTLASYDLFPQFAARAGQTTLLPKPNTVIVYADSNTQMLNSDAIAAASQWFQPGDPLAEEERSCNFSFVRNLAQDWMSLLRPVPRLVWDRF